MEQAAAGPVLCARASSDSTCPLMHSLHCRASRAALDAQTVCQADRRRQSGHDPARHQPLRPAALSCFHGHDAPAIPRLRPQWQGTKGRRSEGTPLPKRIADTDLGTGYRPLSAVGGRPGAFGNCALRWDFPAWSLARTRTEASPGDPRLQRRCAVRLTPGSRAVDHMPIALRRHTGSDGLPELRAAGRHDRPDGCHRAAAPDLQQ